MSYSGLEVIEWIQQFRTPLLDQFFLFCAWFDTGTFYRSLVALTWYVISWRLGLRLLYLLTLSEWSNAWCKALFQLPRPCQVQSNLGVMCLQTHGFPSGAAQSSILIPAFFIHHFRKGWVAALTILFGLLLSFSRLYLGLHFLGDIIGGWAVGLILFGLYYLFEKRIENWIGGHASVFSFIAAVGIPLCLLPFAAKDSVIYGLFLIVGVGIGIHINDFLRIHPVDPKGFWQRTIRAAVTLIAMWLFGILFHEPFRHTDTYLLTLAPTLFGIGFTTLLSGLFKLIRC